MTTDPSPAITALVDTLEPIVSMERDGLVVIALGSMTTPDGPAYLTFQEAAANGAVDVHEVGGGTVPAVAVETRADPVVIFGGDTIVGGKQHRVVNVTIWLTPGKTIHIPVTCLEHGRWDPGTEARFMAGPRADLGLRRMVNRQVQRHARELAHVGAAPAASRYAADQHAVWDEVAARHDRARSSSPTGALHDLYAREAVDVEGLVRAFPYPDGATGAAVGIGGRLVALEVFDRPSTARTLWRRVVEGAVRAHLDHRRLVAAGLAPQPRHRYPDREALGRMLGRVREAQTGALLSPAVGEGTDLRFETDRITGAALLRDGQLVHLEVHRV